MFGIFELKASPASDVNLLLQLIVLLVLIIGIKFAKERNFNRHGNTMILAVILNLLGFLFVMGPNFVSYFVSYFPTPLIHGLSGSLGLIFGIAFIFEKKPKNLKLWMRLTALSWIVAGILGISLYLQIAGVLPVFVK